MFNINFKKLAVWVLPLWLRFENSIMIVMVMTLPIRQIHNNLLLFIQQKRYRLSHNSQVFSMEAVFNDAFDMIDRRIYITDFEGLERIFFWTEAEDRDIDFSVTTYYWEDSFYGDSGVDFVINIPAGIITTSAQLDYLKSLANEYKLAGKNYNINRL